LHALVRPALWLAVLVPVVYFGAQIVAAPFYPGFSVLRDVASLLGSDRSTAPWVLNSGAALTGLFATLSSPAMFVALRRQRVSIWAAAALALSLASLGAASIWAGAHPLPDPRHNPGALGAGMFVLPFAAAIAAWQARMPRGLRAYFTLDALAFVGVAAAQSGLIAYDRAQYSGTAQRVGAVIMFVPVAVMAWWLLRAPARQRATRP